MTRPQITIRGLLILMATIVLTITYVGNFIRMRSAEAELARLRDEVGYLEASDADEIAAVRVASTEPLVWQSRIRVPKGAAYRVAYSAVWGQAKQAPEWFAAQRVPEGESLITVRVLKDPRDDRWKITTIVRHAGGVSRIGTALPEELATVFRGTHDVMSTGVGRQTVSRPAGESIRLFDERYFAGSSMLLYGDQGPAEDLVGIYAELQPDDQPLNPAVARSRR